jgi:hypothetical protein
MDECIECNLFPFLVRLDKFGDDFCDIFHEEDVLINFVVIFFIWFVGSFKCLSLVHQLYNFFYMLKII